MSEMLSPAQRGFLLSLNDDGSPTHRNRLPLVDRIQDRARQKCCRDGLAIFDGKPLRWRITPFGVAALITADKASNP